MNSQENNRFKIEDLKKSNPFQVPENYFDSLGNKITDRVETQAADKKVFFFDSVRLKPILSFAGGFMSLAFLIYLSVSIFQTYSGQSGKTLNHEIGNFNEFSIVSELDQTLLLEEFSAQNNVAGDSLHSENRETIIEYLVKQDIDISTIIDEL